MIGNNKVLVRDNFWHMSKTAPQPPGIATRWPSLLLIKLGRITMHRFTEALEPYGIRPRHLAALIELRDHGELTQQALCGHLHLDPTNVVAVLNELEQRGYAKRTRDPDDRRRHIVEVSKRGLAVIDKVSKVMDEVEAELLEGLDPADRRRFEGLLTTIWETSGGYAALAALAAEDDKAA
jgi:MarR family transcriptional regulator, lower aerobic nicotinate degradation pathway regulator